MCVCVCKDFWCIISVQLQLFSFGHLVVSPVSIEALGTQLVKIITGSSVESALWQYRPCLGVLPSQGAGVQGAWCQDQQSSLQSAEPLNGSKWSLTVVLLFSLWELGGQAQTWCPWDSSRQTPLSGWGLSAKAKGDMVHAAFHLGGVGVRCQPGHSPSASSGGLRGLLVWEQRSFVNTHTEGQLLLTESA